MNESHLEDDAQCGGFLGRHRLELKGTSKLSSSALSAIPSVPLRVKNKIYHFRNQGSVKSKAIKKEIGEVGTEAD